MKLIDADMLKKRIDDRFINPPMAVIDIIDSTKDFSRPEPQDEIEIDGVKFYFKRPYSFCRQLPHAVNPTIDWYSQEEAEALAKALGLRVPK